MSDILIVGGGPIGLALAVGLSKKGISSRVIEKNSGISQFPKASTIHPPTMEILDEWGLYEEAEKQGMKFHSIQFWKRATGELIAEFELDVLKEFTKFPFRLHFDQRFLSQIFLDDIRRSNLADVRYDTELIDIRQDEDKVTVKLKTADGNEVEETYDYVVGADGISSTVRSKLGIPFIGHTNPHYHMIMGLKNYTVNEKYEPLAGAAMFLDSEEWVDIITTPEFVKVIVPFEHDRIEEVTDEFIRAKNKEIGIINEGFDVAYRTIYKTHQLVAEKFHDGRVVLIGDASHVNVEFGGMGMNSGISDAYYLVRKFEKIVKGEDAHQHFAEYARTRKAINDEFVQRDTIRNTKMIQDPEGYHQELRDIRADKEKTKNFLLRTSMLEGFLKMFEY